MCFVAYVGHTYIWYGEQKMANSAKEKKKGGWTSHLKMDYTVLGSSHKMGDNTVQKPQLKPPRAPTLNLSNLIT